MIYLIEGLDGTGKTTLASALSDWLDIPIVKLGADNSRNSVDDDLAVATALGQMQTHDGYDLIMDRGILSGIAYNSDVDIETAMALWDTWQSRINIESVTLVHLVASPATREARDGVGYREHIPTLPLDDFIDFVVAFQNIKGHSLKRIRIDTGEMCIADAVDQIVGCQPSPVVIHHTEGTINPEVFPEAELEPITSIPTPEPERKPLPVLVWKWCIGEGAQMEFRPQGRSQWLPSHEWPTMMQQIKTAFGIPVGGFDAHLPNNDGFRIPAEKWELYGEHGSIARIAKVFAARGYNWLAEAAY